jgi:hypothetical protein
MRAFRTGILAASALAAWTTAPAADESARGAPSKGAEAIIQAANASDLFERADAGQGMAAARHRRSGLICLFFPDGQTNGIDVTPTEGLPRGDDFSCTTNAGGMNLDVFGARYGPSVTVQSQADRLSKDLSRTFSPAKVEMGPSLPGEHPMTSVSASGALGGQPFGAFAIVGQANGWTYAIVCMSPPSGDASCRKTVGDLAGVELRSMSSAALARTP